LVAKYMPHADPVHKVTIIPRGQALGVTHQLPLDDRYNYSRSYLTTQLAIMLGGRSAEEIVFEEITTGAGNDIKRATDMAGKMVTQWGMSDKLGPLTYGDKEEEIFLGREIAQHRDYSESTAQEVDEEVRRLVREAHDKAREILTENLQILHNMADALLEHETLDEKYIDIIINGGSINGKDSPIQEEKEDDDESGESAGQVDESPEAEESQPEPEASVDEEASQGDAPDSEQKEQ
ncbi:MAG: cell division protein FtsH, partial [Candidatus Marinimicrobia bacterium]|nr:cell division protein FtsH [Candidatus Neomarinimicrobiota bacterium]